MCFCDQAHKAGFVCTNLCKDTYRKCTPKRISAVWNIRLWSSQLCWGAQATGHGSGEVVSECQKAPSQPGLRGEGEAGALLPWEFRGILEPRAHPGPPSTSKSTSESTPGPPSTSKSTSESTPGPPSTSKSTSESTFGSTFWHFWALFRHFLPIFRFLGAPPPGNGRGGLRALGAAPLVVWQGSGPTSTGLRDRGRSLRATTKTPQPRSQEVPLSAPSPWPSRTGLSSPPVSSNWVFFGPQSPDPPPPQPVLRPPPLATVKVLEGCEERGHPKEVLLSWVCGLCVGAGQFGRRSVEASHFPQKPCSCGLISLCCRANVTV